MKFIKEVKLSLFTRIMKYINKIVSHYKTKATFNYFSIFEIQRAS